MAQRKNRNGIRNRRRRSSRLLSLGLGLAAALILMVSAVLWAQSATDPGPRGGQAGAGTFQMGLKAPEINSECDFKGQFNQAASVPFNSPMGTGCPSGGGANALWGAGGLGPRFSSNSCASCHAQPAVGGSSPPSNPLFGVYQLDGATNTMPSFEQTNGPVLVARFPFVLGNPSLPDGLQHQLFTIAGRSDAGSCNLAQPDFTDAQAQNDLVFRQPLPTFGDGYIEMIQNVDIINNMNSNLNLKQPLGIGGAVNIADDGTVSRLGWKAQWRAILPASGAEENVEEGVTNEMFPTETDQSLATCLTNPIPEDFTGYNWYGSSWQPWNFLANAERDADFIRFLEQPTPTTSNCIYGPQSCENGAAVFQNIGCALCHTVYFTTPAGSIPSMGGVTAYLYSDLLLHHMGPCLADGISQGVAQGDMWRTPPLWNVGQRYWFMHDGRTSDITQAIQDHNCAGNSQYPASEANGVVNNYNALANNGTTDQQDLINFLRSL